MYHFMQAVDDGELVGSMYGLRKRHPDPDHDSRAADSMPADMSRADTSRTLTRRGGAAHQQRHDVA
jgi:hypothetical protein